MSRYTMIVNENITCYHGSDHALGSWLDFADKRYAGHETDETGDGFVMEYSEKLGFMSNKAGIALEDLQNPNGKDTIISKIDTFVNSLK